MEYPQGANFYGSALASPPCSGIQKPGLRHPRYKAGSQKRLHGTGGGFLCAPGRLQPQDDQDFSIETEALFPAWSPGRKFGLVLIQGIQKTCEAMGDDRTAGQVATAERCFRFRKKNLPPFAVVGQRLGEAIPAGSQLFSIFRLTDPLKSIPCPLNLCLFPLAAEGLVAGAGEA